ncbi:hypothetical protein Tco_0597634 [Tanacetum coccineum]
MELLQGATSICEGSCRLTFLERQEVWNDCMSCKVRIGSNGNLLWEASVFLGRKKDDRGVTEGREDVREVFQQRRSGAKRKLSKCGRNQMGNKLILALPEGADDFVFLFDELRVLMPRVVKSRDEIFSRWGYCDNHDLSRLDNQSIERDRLIGIGFVLNFVKFISFTFGDKEMISVIEAIIREVFVKLLLKSSGKLSIRHGLYETIVCYVLLANMIWIVVLERDRLKALMDC